MFGLGQPDKEEEVWWRRRSTRNIFRAAVLAACLTFGLVGLAFLNWHSDLDTSRGAKFAVSGVQLTKARGSNSWSQEKEDFCAYVDSTTASDGWEGSDFAEDYPPGGTIDLAALCLALEDMGFISKVTIWTSATFLSLWAVQCVIFATGGPWTVRERPFLIPLFGAMAIFCIPMLAAVSIWEAWFGDLKTAGMPTAPAAGLFLSFGCCILTFLALPPAAMDIILMPGYENLNQFRWPSKDPMQMQRAAAHQHDPAGYQQQPQPQLAAPAAPMGGLLRPGERPKPGVYQSTQQRPQQQAGEGYGARAPFGYGL